MDYELKLVKAICMADPATHIESLLIREVMTECRNIQWLILNTLKKGFDFVRI